MIWLQYFGEALIGFVLLFSALSLIASFLGVLDKEVDDKKFAAKILVWSTIVFCAAYAGWRVL